MAHLDQFIDMMVRRHVDRALLINDQPGHLWSAGQESPGPIIPRQQLQNIVQEVTPPAMRQQLARDGAVEFSHTSPHGTYEVHVQRNGQTLQVHLVQAGAAQADAAQNGAAHSNGTPASTQVAAPAETAAATTPPVTTAPRGTQTIRHIDDLFRMMKEVEASDLHLSSGQVPMLRIHGVMKKLEDYAVLDHESLTQILFAIAPKRNREQWEETRDTDFSYELKNVARFRCNLFSDRHGICGVFRLIPSEIVTVEELNLPKAMTDLCYLSKGLVVVTGPTGSGKSTTLAALIDHINKNRTDHIVTVEDPVEFVHENKGCLINQREVHVHTESFARALRASLREDPDVILVGEMRDLETTKLAIEAAETGHLVFGTVHTSSAASTVDRIIDQFPPEEQEQIRVMLSETLKGVIAQMLLRTRDGKRVAAFEILLVPTAVSNLIREGKTFQLGTQMQMGKSQGMVTMNESILKYVVEGRVDPLEGYVKATDKASLLQSYEANNIHLPSLN
jgi:twitching motility protein PilT